jgi:cytochrome c peroxidase
LLPAQFGILLKISVKMKKLLLSIILLISFSIALQSCNNLSVENASTTPSLTIDQKENIKLWLKSNQVFKPLPILKFDSTEENLAKLKLGKLLYFEKRLSKNNNISCNSCHQLNKFGVDNEPTSLGTTGARGGRNSPTTLNAYLHTSQFWDGRAENVEKQAQGPILNPVEMGLPHAEFVVDKIANIPGLISLFKTAYPNETMTFENLTKSIGFFERTLLTPSKFDVYLTDDIDILNSKEKRGLQLYLETGCQSCHTGVAVGGSRYEKFGKFDDYWKYTGSKKIDAGKFDLTKNDNDKYRFKVPSLRNIEKTYPYFHDGSVTNLNEAIKIMAKIQLNKELTQEQTNDIEAFLKTLTGNLKPYTKNL